MSTDVRMREFESLVAVEYKCVPEVNSVGSR